MMAGLQDTDQFAVARVELGWFEDIDVRLRSLAVHVWMQVQIALVVLLVDFRQYPSFVSDHLVFAEIRSGIIPVVAGHAVTVQHRLHFQTEGERTDASFRCFQPACLLG